MSLSGHLTRKLLVPPLTVLLGRRNLVRLARLLTMESRFDYANDMSDNGELLVQDVLLRNAPIGRPLTVFDVGANIGDWTSALLARRATSDLRIHAFEPASATFRMLEEKLRNHAKEVILENLALSNEVGKSAFFVAGAGLGTNSLHSTGDHAGTTEQVTLNTVDSYCQQAKITNIDLLKIDAEGHDIGVIEGARSMLQSRSISLIQFEYNQRWIGSRHYLRDAFELLQPLGYKLGKITPKGIEFYPDWHFELESFREGNYLACRDEWSARFPHIKWWNLK